MEELTQYFNKADNKFSFEIDGAVVTLSNKGDEIYLTDSKFSALPKELQDKLTTVNPLVEDKKEFFKK